MEHESAVGKVGNAHKTRGKGHLFELTQKGRALVVLCVHCQHECGWQVVRPAMVPAPASGRAWGTGYEGGGAVAWKCGLRRLLSVCWLNRVGNTMGQRSGGNRSAKNKKSGSDARVRGLDVGKRKCGRKMRAVMPPLFSIIVPPC